MVIKLGTTDISKIYLGEQELSKVYLGSELIYPINGPSSPFKATLVGLINDNGSLKPSVDSPNYIQGPLGSQTYLGTNDGEPPNCYIEFPLTIGLTYFCYMGDTALQYARWGFLNQNRELLGVIDNLDGWAGFWSNFYDASTWQQEMFIKTKSNRNNNLMTVSSSATYAPVTFLNIRENKVSVNFPYPANSFNFEFDISASNYTRLMTEAKYIYLTINFNSKSAPSEYPIDMIGILDTRNMSWTQSNFRSIAKPENNKIEW